MTNEVLVEDEEEIAEGDLITVRVSVTRGNLDEGEKAPDVHAPYFPTVKQEGWWFILATETKYIITMEKVRHRLAWCSFTCTNAARKSGSLKTARLLTCMVASGCRPIQVYDNNRTFTHDIKCFGPGMMLQAGHYKFDLYIISDSYIGLDVTQKVRGLRGHKDLPSAPLMFTHFASWSCVMMRARCRMAGSITCGHVFPCALGLKMVKLLV